MLNWIWLAFILIAVVVGGFTGHFEAMTKGAFETAEFAVMKVALPLIGIWAIWLGMMRLAEQSGLVQWLARALRPLLRRLFPDVPPEHPAMGAIVMNMSANMLGLSNAATPLGLRAMALLESLNPRPGVATNAMCTFLAINTASIQIIPTTAIGILAVQGSQNPAIIVPTAFLATVCAASAGVIAAKLLERLPFFQIDPAVAQLPVPQGAGAPAAVADAVPAIAVTHPPLGLVRTGILVLFFASFAVITFQQIAAQEAARGWGIAALQAVAKVAVPFMLSFFPLYGALRGLQVYEQFVEGAREAFATAQRVIPYLVGMLLSIGLLKEAGVIGYVTDALRPFLNVIGFPADLLPMVLMRPLSGSGTQALFIELVHRLGPDALVSRLAGTIYGSTETTFYVLAVYFGSVAIRRTRHAVAAGLIADTTAVIASLVIGRWML